MELLVSDSLGVVVRVSDSVHAEPLARRLLRWRASPVRAAFPRRVGVACHAGGPWCRQMAAGRVTFSLQQRRFCLSSLRERRWILLSKISYSLMEPTFAEVEKRVSILLRIKSEISLLMLDVNSAVILRHLSLWSPVQCAQLCPSSRISPDLNTLETKP